MSAGATRRRAVLLALAALATLAGGCGNDPPAQTDGWSVWLLRHAEKADDGTRDPPLDATGTARAAALAAAYADAGIERVWTTPYRRTRDTVAPLADAIGLPLRDYDPRVPEALVATLRDEARNAIVVGHSNTIPDLTARLCECPVEAMADDEYGRVARVRFGPGGPVLETWFEHADGTRGTAAGTPAPVEEPR